MPSQREHHLVLVGGGHAHLTTLLHADQFVRQGHRVTLISPSPYHYYSGMGPGALSDTYRPEEIRFHIRKMAQTRGADFVSGTVAKVKPQERMLCLHSGTEIGYDVASFNVGSYVPTDPATASTPHTFTVKPIDHLLTARQAILELLRQGRPRLMVIGGGPAGVELAGNLWRLVRKHGQARKITLLCSGKLMAAFPAKVRRLVMESFSARGIAMLEGTPAAHLTPEGAILADGRQVPADAMLLAWGIKPANLFRDSGLPVDPAGGLLVNDYLQSVDYPEVFGGGDCISLAGQPLDKVGVYPVRQNPILYHNLLAAVNGKELTRFKPGGRYLLIFNLGNDRAIFCRNQWVWSGKPAYRLKDYIDRRFMRKFQVSGELETHSA